MNIVIQVFGYCCILLASSLTLANAADFSSKEASSSTITQQKRVKESLPKDDGGDAEFAQRGFVATVEDPVVRNEQGGVVFDATRLDWMEGDAPYTVNPSLWRQMKLMKKHGLFKVSDDVWQVRGLSGANLMVVQGKQGWIVIDPAMSVEAAAKAMQLVNQHLGERPVTGVLYTHSHPDHFAGVRGLEFASPDIPIIAPEHFLEETVSEFLVAGNAMSRRGTLMFGIALDSNPKGWVGNGITSGAELGSITLIPPNDYIKETGDTRQIDGVTFHFQMVPETEAPAEMNFYLPQQAMLYISEFATCTLHNVQTPRGALVRDSVRWAGFITEAIDLYGRDAKVMAGGHCWPRFGNDEVNKFLSLQRDNYKFIHDQTVRLMNEGETPFEIAEQLTRPEALANEWSNRGYYATVRHNAKGVYQRYIGWWSGIPAHLNLHPPVEQGRRYVKAFGGARKILKIAREAMREGDYRWSAELLNHLVFAQPENDIAKALLADSYEQMGYQAESAVWRNIYLTGAAELRGLEAPRPWLSSPDLIAAMPLAGVLQMVATQIDPAVIGDRKVSILTVAVDKEESVLSTIENSVMVNRPDPTTTSANVQLAGTLQHIMGLFLMKRPVEKMRQAGMVIEGDTEALNAFLSAIKPPPPGYAIVVP